MKLNLLRVLCILTLSLQPLSAQPPEDEPKITLKAVSDYLALHVSGSLPKAATDWEYRLSLADDPKADTWASFPQPPASDGSFKFDVPLSKWRWAELEVRATLDGKPLTADAQPGRHEFKMLTGERIAALPDAPRAAWQEYMRTSQRHSDHERDALAAECRKLGLAIPQAEPKAKTGAEFEMRNGVDADWYGSAEAGKLADAVLSYQTLTGAWVKAINYAAGPRALGTPWTNNAENPWHYCGTLDNRTTTEQIRFLANVFRAAKREDAKAGALRGMEWLFMAQFPNGGWPQNYPVEPGYHEAITLNDDAMLHAMELMLSASKGEAPFDFLESAIRERAATAFDRAVTCLLACQVKVDGKPTVWCAQHDPLSLAPVGARLKEPPSLSGAESANLLKFLMRKGPVTPEVVGAIESGIAWLSAHRVTGMRKTRTAEGKTDYVADAESSEVYWARFYDVQTGLPMFAGAQDGKVYGAFHEMAQHNKVGYDYYSTKPADVVGKEADRWRKRIAKERP
jgi:PelA/Pel-15E family pectate lyase